MDILILEDEKLAAEKLEKLLEELDDNYNVIEVIDSVDDAVDWLNRNPCPDLILSDIHLTDGLCFAIFSQTDADCPVIFTTAYEKYAIQAFEVNSVDYLLKPIQKDKLEAALEKFKSLHGSRKDDRTSLYQEFQDLLSNGRKDYKARFLCKLGNKIKSVPVKDIAYFYSESKMTFLVNKENQRFPVNNTLDEIDQMLDPDHFFRVNRKYVTHFESIDEIHPYFKGRLKLILSPGRISDVIVSSEKAPVLKAWLDK